MKKVKKIFVILLKKLDLGSAIAVRLVMITGKARYPVHPKHFLSEKPWFAKYLTPKDAVLDAGCGNGQNTLKVAKVVRKIIGLDVNKDLLSIGMSQARRRKIKNIFFKTSDLEHPLSFKENLFNKVIFLDVLEHLKNRDQIMQEIKRVLKPKGLLFLGVPNNQTSWKKYQRSVGISSYSDPDHKIEYSEKTIRKVLEKHEFKIIQFSYGKFDTPLRGLFDVIGSISFSAYRVISKWREEKTKEDTIEANGFEIVCKNIK